MYRFGYFLIFELAVFYYLISFVIWYIFVKHFGLIQILTLFQNNDLNQSDIKSKNAIPTSSAENSQNSDTGMFLKFYDFSSTGN